MHVAYQSLAAAPLASRIFVSLCLNLTKTTKDLFEAYLNNTISSVVVEILHYIQTNLTTLYNRWIISYLFHRIIDSFPRILKVKITRLIPGL